MSESGIKAAGNKVLVKPEPVEEETSGGIVIASATLEKDKIRQFVGHVVSIGCCAWEDYEGPEWCAEGDRVTYSQHAGQVMKGKDGEEYRLMNDRDINAIVEEGFKP